MSTSCPALYVLNVSDPAHPICEPGPVLKVPGVGWVWSNRHVVVPAAVVAGALGVALKTIGVPAVFAIGGALVAFAIVGYGIAFMYVARI